ncbi:MAG: phage head closure protein [Planctomycetota bacterium]
MTRALANPRGLGGPSPTMLNTTISTERATKTATKGDVVTTFAENLTGIPASVQPGQSREAVQIGAERGVQTYDVYTAAGQDITDSDRLVTADGLKLNILGSRDMAGRGRATHYICTRTEGVTSA